MDKTTILAEVKALATNLDEYWGERIKLDDEEREFIRGTHEIETPNTRVLGMTPEAITMGIGAEEVRHVKGLFPYGNYIVSPQGTGPKPKRDAEKVADWLNAVSQALEDDASEDTRDLRDDDVVSHGRGATVVLPLFKRYTTDHGYPEQADEESDKDFNKRVEAWRKTANIPISMRHYPIAQCRPLLSGRWGVVKALVKSQEAGHDIAEQWPDSDLVQNMKPEDKAKRYEVWLYLDERWCAYLWAGKEGHKFLGLSFASDVGEVLDMWEHKMGVCPFNFTVGEVTADNDPKYRYKGRVYDLMPLAKGRDRLASRQLTAVKVQALAPPIFKTKEPYSVGAGMPQRNIEYTSDGQPVPLFADESLEQPLEYPLQAEAEAMDFKLKEQIERHAYTDVIAGIGGSDQSGIHFLYRSKAARNVFTPLGQHLADGTRRDGQLLLRAVIALGESVVVRKSSSEGTDSVELTPELAQRFLDDIHVDRSPEFPEDEGRDLDNVGKAQELGMAPGRAWQQFGHITDPEKMIEESLVWEFLMGAGREALKQEAMLRAGLLASQEEAMLPADLANIMPNLPGGLQRALVQPQGAPQGPPMQPQPMPVAGGMLGG